MNRKKYIGYWSGKHLPDEMKRKISNSMIGRNHTEETKRKMSVSKMGNKSPWWRGGISTELNKRTSDPRWHVLRKQIYQRDNWRCGICGIPYGKKIQCHHILPVAESGTDNWNNLITLCMSHHRKIEYSRFQQFWRHYLGKKIKTSLN